MFNTAAVCQREKRKSFHLCRVRILDWNENTALVLVLEVDDCLEDVSVQVFD